MLTTLERRFWDKVDRQDPDQCWPITSQPSMKYPMLWVDKGFGFQGIHRVSFFLKHGYWPNVARHTCDNSRCANWDHILNGTLADNNRDMVARGRSRNGRETWTHCKRGHPFRGANLRVNPSTGQRVCRSCGNERSRQHLARRRAKRRELKAPETHCKRGHLWANNIRWQGPDRKWRYCTACATERGRERRKVKVTT